MRNKIVGTNIIKSKYLLKELTSVDLHYLKQQNIKCYQLLTVIESRFLFTSYKSMLTYVKNNYNLPDLTKLLSKAELTALGTSHERKLTMIDILDFLSWEYDFNEHTAPLR